MRRRRTPYNAPPQPQAIDDYTGFKVNLADLKKDWAGLYAKHPDKRNPQDFVRGVKDNAALPFARPEVPDTFLAEPIVLETGEFLQAEQGGLNIFGEGVTVEL